jgi:hypothetical protein
MASITLTDKNLTIVSDRTTRPVVMHIKSNISIAYSGTNNANGTVKLMINGHPFVFGAWERSYLGQLDTVGATDVSAFTPANKAAQLAALVKNI